MDNVEIFANRVADTMRSLGTVELSGIKLEEAKPELLNIQSLNLDVHVAMHPAALAYYGQLRKDAMRIVSELKNKRERWGKAKYAEAKAACLRDMPKATVADIEARVITDNIDELNEMDAAESKAQQIFDTLDVWYEAWKQKGYSLREHISMELAERANTSTSFGFDDGSPAIPPAKISVPVPQDAASAISEAKGGFIKPDGLYDISESHQHEAPSVSACPGDNLDKLAKKFGKLK